MSSSNLTMIKKDGKIILAHMYSFRGNPEEMGLYYLHLLRCDGGLSLKEKLCNYKVMDESVYAKYCMLDLLRMKSRYSEIIPRLFLVGDMSCLSVYYPIKRLSPVTRYSTYIPVIYAGATLLTMMNQRMRYIKASTESH